MGWNVPPGIFGVCCFFYFTHSNQSMPIDAWLCSVEVLMLRLLFTVTQFLLKGDCWVSLFDFKIVRGGACFVIWHHIPETEPHHYCRYSLSFQACFVRICYPQCSSSSAKCVLANTAHAFRLTGIDVYSISLTVSLFVIALGEFTPPALCPEGLSWKWIPLIFQTFLDVTVRGKHDEDVFPTQTALNLYRDTHILI